MRDPAWRDAFPQQVLDAVTVEDARLDEELAAREERLQEQVARLAELHEQVLAHQKELLTLQEEQARLVASLLERERDLAMLSSSVTWRLRERLVGLRIPERADQMGCQGSSSSSSARRDWLVASRSETRGDWSGQLSSSSGSAQWQPSSSSGFQYSVTA